MLPSATSSLVEGVRRARAVMMVNAHQSAEVIDAWYPDRLIREVDHVVEWINEYRSKNPLSDV